MGQVAEISILDFEDVEYVIKPVLKIADNVSAPTLAEINKMLEGRFQHENYFATSTSDLMAHI